METHDQVEEPKTEATVKEIVEKFVQDKKSTRKGKEKLQATQKETQFLFTLRLD